MKRIYNLAFLMGLLLTVLSASAEKTAYGFTMYPSASPSMISFDIDDLSSTTSIGTYSRAEPRSGTLVGHMLYMMGADADFNIWFFTMDTKTGTSSSIKRMIDATTPADLSYDYSTSTLYFIANSETVDGVSAIGTINMGNGKMTFTKDLNYYCKAIAIDARGQMYTMTSSGDLLKVNKETGETRVIGSTGIEFSSLMNFQSMEFDRQTGTLYLAAWTKDNKSSLYTIDLATGAASLLGDIGDGSHMIALGIPYEPTDDSAPKNVTDPKIAADVNGDLNATISWINPVNNYSGHALEEPISIEIVNMINDETTVLQECQPGDTMYYAVEVKDAGMYAFSITAFNREGSSLSQIVETWIGHDVPAAPTNAEVMLNRSELTVNDLTWDAPVTGAHGGYLDMSSLSYDIVRLNDGRTIGEEIIETTFTDYKLLDELSRYRYQITAKNADGTGESVITNELVNGPTIGCPYVAPFNSWEESGQYWTVLDANDDNYPFVWYKDDMNMFGQGDDKCFFIYQKHETNNAYDFIISPPINFIEGHEYKITATVSNDDRAGYREESFRFYSFTGYDMVDATPLGDESFTVKHPGEFRDYSITITIEDDGNGDEDESHAGFIALCCDSQCDMGMLLVSKIAIEGITPTVTGDVNGDGEVNIGDVNALIDMILSGDLNATGDVNNDGEVTVSDFNALIDIILSL